MLCTVFLRPLSHRPCLVGIFRLFSLVRITGVKGAFETWSGPTDTKLVEPLEVASVGIKPNNGLDRAQSGNPFFFIFPDCLNNQGNLRQH